MVLIKLTMALCGDLSVLFSTIRMFRNGSEVNFLKLKLHFDRVEVVNYQVMIREDLVEDILVEVVDSRASGALLSAIESYPNVRQLSVNLLGNLTAISERTTSSEADVQHRKTTSEIALQQMAAVLLQHPLIEAFGFLGNLSDSCLNGITTFCGALLAHEKLINLTIWCLCIQKIAFQTLLATVRAIPLTLQSLNICKYTSCVELNWVASLAESLQLNRTLKHLDLSASHLSSASHCGPEGALALAEMLKVNQTLTHLSLDWNLTFSTKGVLALSETLANSTTLEYLNLTFLEGTVHLID